MEDAGDGDGGGGALWNFVMISGVLGAIYVGSGLVMGFGSNTGEDSRGSKKKKLAKDD